MESFVVGPEEGNEVLGAGKLQDIGVLFLQGLDACLYGIVEQGNVDAVSSFVIVVVEGLEDLFDGRVPGDEVPVFGVVERKDDAVGLRTDADRGGLLRGKTFGVSEEIAPACKAGGAFAFGRVAVFAYKAFGEEVKAAVYGSLFE